MSYRVCIPTAGTGSRLGSLTQYLNKSLVSVANRPILSHLIEQFPSDAEFVIALGHKGHLVREFLALAYSERKFYFAEVSPFEGEGSGLGLSLLACKEFLQTPFVFISCDTLVSEPIPAPTCDWMAYAQTPDLAPYRCLAVSGGTVQAILEKGEGTALDRKAYIGLSGIHDHQTFWEAMSTGGQLALNTGEAHGLRALLAGSVKAHPFTWFDTGNPLALETARKQYAQSDAPHILEKTNESIWFIGSDVIKFSDDKKFIANRVARADSMKGFVPSITGSTTHMYRYELAEGDVLSSAITLPMLEKLLCYSREFWKPARLGPRELLDFKLQCMTFYKNKTFERVDLFYKSFNKRDEGLPINGVAMPRTESLLNSVDWEWLSDGTPVRFHGDFHFENIIWNHEAEKFTFLDWRQDFAGDMSKGDIYYDFAKLMHGLIVSHELIAKDLYSVSWSDKEISFDLNRKQSLVQCEKEFAHWLMENGYDLKKVLVLTALIYLNIAALHHHPYCLLLYALGKDLLNTQINSSLVAFDNQEEKSNGNSQS